MRSRRARQSCEVTDGLVRSVPSRNRRGPKEWRGMKRVVVGHYGGPEVLQVVEEDDPRPGPGEVRVRVLAAGVSFSDALLRSGGRLEVLAEVAQVADDLVERLDRAGVPDEDELASLVAGFPRCG